MRDASKNPRPRKYASDAERQAAYRARYAIVQVRLKPEMVAKIEGIAESRDLPRADILAELIGFALANRHWHTAPRFAPPVVKVAQGRRRATKFSGIEIEGDDDA